MARAEAHSIIVAGTDTGVGKTVFAAALTAALDGAYWKPVQSGARDGTDAERVRTLTGLGADRVLAERYLLREPLSPHLASRLEGVTIERRALAALPRADRPLVIEAAGGVLVPLAPGLLQADLWRDWDARVVLCARTTLGTINHALLSLEALKARSIPVLGVAFIGDPDEGAERAVAELSGARRLGRLAWLDPLGPEALRRAFSRAFRLEDFLEAPARR